MQEKIEKGVAGISIELLKNAKDSIGIPKISDKVIIETALERFTKENLEK